MEFELEIKWDLVEIEEPWWILAPEYVDIYLLHSPLLRGLPASDSRVTEAVSLNLWVRSLSDLRAMEQPSRECGFARSVGLLSPRFAGEYAIDRSIDRYGERKKRGGGVAG